MRRNGKWAVIKQHFHRHDDQQFFSCKTRPNPFRSSIDLRLKIAEDCDSIYIRALKE